MIKVLTLKLFKDLKAGVLRQPDFVFDATPERFEELKSNLGDGFVVEVRIVEETIKDPFANTDLGELADEVAVDDAVTTVTEEIYQGSDYVGVNVETYPKHTGGGYYELSNGEKIKGKDAAIEAEKAL